MSGHGVLVLRLKPGNDPKAEAEKIANAFAAEYVPVTVAAYCDRVELLGPVEVLVELAKFFGAEVKT